LTIGGRSGRIVTFMISPHRSVLVAGLAVLALVVCVAVIAGAQGGAPLDRPAPEISGGPWINSAALTPAELRGRVVLVDFWTYG
jgi:hypothetical protein